MKPLIIISSVVAIGFLAVVTGIPRSHSLSTVGRAGTASMSSLREMQSGRAADRLVAEDFDDRSLVFPRESGRKADARTDPHD